MRENLALLAGLAMLHATACVAQAASTTSSAPSALTAQDAWVRATPGADVAAAYLTLHNGGKRPVVIVGVRSALAGHAMIHETMLSGGASSMRPRQTLRVAPGETIRLAPGRLHIMLAPLSRALTPGERVALELLLEGGGVLEVGALVRPLSAG